MAGNKRTGLIAGGGSLPEIWLEAARLKGLEVFAYRLKEEDPLSLETANQVQDVSLANLGDILDRLKEDEIDQVIFLGKVHKEHLYQGIEPDAELAEMLENLDDYMDMTILEAINKRFEEEGFKILPQSSYIEKLLPEAGLLAGPEPSEDLRMAMKQALRLAKELAEFDIGQTLLYKAGQVIAVEALEGTDETIARAGDLAGEEGDLILAKAARPDQDFRSDIPAIGAETLRNLAEAGGQAVIIEAEKVFMLEEEEVIELADQLGITVMAG